MSNPYTGYAPVHLQPYPGDFFANLAEKGADRTEKLDDLMSKVATTHIPVKPGVDTQKQQVFEAGIKQGLSQTADDFANGKIDARQTHRRVMDAYNQLTNDPGVLARMQSKTAYDEAVTGLHSLRLEGKDHPQQVSDFLNTAQAHDSEVDGVYNDYPKPFISPDVYSERLLDSITKTDLGDGYVGVDEPTIRKFAIDNAPQFLHDNPYGGINDLQSATSYLYTRGMKQYGKELDANQLRAEELRNKQQKEDPSLVNPYIMDMQNLIDKGQTTINPVKAPIYLGTGSKLKDDGSFSINLSGYKPEEKIIDLAQVTGADPNMSEQERAKLNSAIALKAQFNQLFKDNLAKVESNHKIPIGTFSSTNFRNLNRFFKNLRKIDYALNGAEGLNLASTMEATGSLAQSEEAAVTRELTKTMLANPTYQKLQAKAKALGYSNLTEITTPTDSDKLETLQKLSKFLSLSGEANARTAPGDAMIVDENGDPRIKVIINKPLQDYGTGDNKITTDDLQNLAKEGYIQTGNPIKGADGKTQETFDIPMYLPVKGNAGQITDQMMSDPNIVRSGDLSDKNKLEEVGRSNQWANYMIGSNSGKKMLLGKAKQLLASNKITADDLKEITSNLDKNNVNYMTNLEKKLAELEK